MTTANTDTAELMVAYRDALSGAYTSLEAWLHTLEQPLHVAQLVMLKTLYVRISTEKNVGAPTDNHALVMHFIAAKRIINDPNFSEFVDELASAAGQRVQ